MLRVCIFFLNPLFYLCFFLFLNIKINVRLKTRTIGIDIKIYCLNSSKIRPKKRTIGKIYCLNFSKNGVVSITCISESFKITSKVGLLEEAVKILLT